MFARMGNTSGVDIRGVGLVVERTGVSRGTGRELRSKNMLELVVMGGEAAWMVNVG